MARVPNTMRDIAGEALEYIEDRFTDAKQLLEKIDGLNGQLKGANFDPALVTTFKATLREDSKTNVVNATKMLRWLFTTFNITTIPPAFSDADVDAINADIRTTEA